MKTQVKKLIKSALFGVTVLGGAMVMQSFGENVKSQDPHIVNMGNGSFEPRQDYDPQKCQSTEPTPCAYLIVEPSEIPNESSFTPTDIDNFLLNGWIEPLSLQGVYND